MQDKPEAKKKKYLTATESIRAKCLDCSGGEKGEIRKCPVVDCPLWPRRLGRNPNFEKKEVDPEKKAMRQALIEAARERKRIKSGTQPDNE